MISKTETNIDVERLYRDEQFMPLLPLLEQPFQTVKNTYPGVSEKNFQDLVLYALAWEAEDYWPTRAMEWLDGGVNPSSQILDKISELSQDDRMPEKLKQRMRILLEDHLEESLI